jgi:hypothetical protein
MHERTDKISVLNSQFEYGYLSNDGEEHKKKTTELKKNDMIVYIYSVHLTANSIREIKMTC